MMWWKSKPSRRAAFEGLLPKLAVERCQDIATNLTDPTVPLHRWSRGIAIATPVFVMAAMTIRGWQDAAALQRIACIGLLAFSWSYLLVRASRHPDIVRRLGQVLWVNSVVLSFLVTAILSVTGSSLSPLFWLYLILIAAETLQDRQRGVVVAWLSCTLFCGLIITQALQWLPAEHTGGSPVGSAWLVHALGIALWYLVIAVGVLALLGGS